MQAESYVQIGSRSKMTQKKRVKCGFKESRIW